MLKVVRWSLRGPLVAAAGVLWLGGPGGSAYAEPQYDPGASDTEIRIGNTAPYSGPFSSYGTVVRTVAATIEKVNDEGGINGRKIVLLSYDDGFLPARTLEQTRKLVERDRVLFMFLGIGGAPQSAVQRYLNQWGVPQLFVSSGSSRWNDPENHPWTMAILPSLKAEARVYTRYALENVSEPRIGVLYQNDDDGKDYLAGVHEELGDRASELIVAELSYEVTDPTVESQIVTLKDREANVFMNFAGGKFAVQAIRKAYDIGWRPLHLMTYYSSSREGILKPAGFEKSKGIMTVTSLKDPSDPKWKDDQEIRTYRATMKEYYPEGAPDDLFNFYGYGVTHALIHVLTEAGDNLTRANIMDVARNMRGVRLPGMLPGISLNTGPDDYAPWEQFYLLRFNGERWEIVSEMIDLERAE